MKNSEILKEALVTIENGKENYVCHAISTVVDPGWMYLHEVNHPLLDIIHYRLAGCTTVLQYLSQYHSKWYYEHIDKGRVTARDYRIAWIKQMIQEFEAKGE